MNTADEAAPLRTIWLIRHGKSSWADPGQADRDRPLNDRGRRDGSRMQRWLAEQSAPARWLWVSSARRAQETAAFVQAGFAVAEDDTATREDLYLADADTLLAVLRETPAEVESVALVAHNPGITDAVNAFVGHRLMENVPTFGVARLLFHGAWPELAFGSTELVSLDVPKELFSP